MITTIQESDNTIREQRYKTRKMIQDKKEERQYKQQDETSDKTSQYEPRKDESFFSSCIVALLSYCHSLGQSLSYCIIALVSSHRSRLVSLCSYQSIKSTFKSHCNYYIRLRCLFPHPYSPCYSCRCSVCCSSSQRLSCPGYLHFILCLNCPFTTFLVIILIEHIRSFILRH